MATIVAGTIATASAQQTDPGSTGRPHLDTTTGLPPDAVSIAKVIGSPIFNIQGLAIAHVYDIVLDENGQATLAVIAVDATGGGADKLVAIPWSKLIVGTGPAELVVDVPEDELVAAPEFSYIHRGF